jgi:S1-C subfamily serine protease
MLKNIVKIISFVAIALLGGILGGQILRLPQDGGPVYVTEKKEVYIQENNALENAIDKTKNVIVGVRSKTAGGKITEGSGLTLTSDGLMLTLSSLIPKGSTFYFYVDGKPVNYQILKRDAVSDLALIKLEKNNLATVGFVETDKIKLGQRVFLLGNLFASSTPEIFAREGIISRIGQNFFETDIAKTGDIQGSILFDIEGKIIGVNKLNKDGNLIVVPASVIKAFGGF